MFALELPHQSLYLILKKVFYVRTFRPIVYWFDRFFDSDFPVYPKITGVLAYLTLLLVSLFAVFGGFSFVYFGFLFFLTTIASLFFLSYLGMYGVFFLNLFSLFFFWLSLISQFNFFFASGHVVKICIGKWLLLSPDFKSDFDFYIDVISFSFVVLTTSIALCVYCYAFSYFRQEPNVDRLMLFLNLFVISMIIFVCSGNLIVIFFGWELIGTTSFLLINFWSTRVSTLKAAFKAFVFNKISDVFLLIFCITIYNIMHTTDVMSITQQINLYSSFTVDILCFSVSVVEFLSFLIISAACIKSAQFGPHIWLPDSMEAPVPASALIHSATLVSAGIFLMLRFTPILELSIFSYYFLPIIGSITAFSGGLIAIFQHDIKRILAYSTISHCGFLVVSCSLFSHEYTIIYLYVHGFFKAASFLCVGNIIRFSLNCQDIRFMGSYYKYLPFECCALFICFLHLGGAPFTLGFLIKHLLLVTLDLNIYYVSYFVYVNVMLAALTGIFYCSKIFYNVFFDYRRARKAVYISYHKNTFNFHKADSKWSTLPSQNWFYFTCSTMASTFSIFFLIVMAYPIVLYLLFNLCKVDSSTDIISNLNLSNFFNFFTNSNSTLFNFGFFNILGIFVFIIITNSFFSAIATPWSVYSRFFSIFIFFIFFYFFYLIF